MVVFSREGIGKAGQAAEQAQDGILRFILAGSELDRWFVLYLA